MGHPILSKQTELPDSRLKVSVKVKKTINVRNKPLQLNDLPDLWSKDDDNPRESSLNPFIHGERIRNAHEISSSTGLSRRETYTVNRGCSNQWLGVPLNMQHNLAISPIQHEKPVKLPAFTGKDSWKVWYNRFNTIAELNNWAQTTRWNQLLPRLQGDAGEFVYGELPQDITCNFTKLIEELENRFRMIETHKTCAAECSKRNQLPGETTEEYAAALKRLYDKAHIKRIKKAYKRACSESF